MSPAWIDDSIPPTLSELLVQFKQLTAKVNRLEQQIASGFAALEHLPGRFDRLEAHVKLAVCQTAPIDVVAVRCDEQVGCKQAEPVRRKLPAKVMEAIFKHLSASELATARAVCRRWSRIIGTSASLMDNFVVEFPAGTRLQADCEPVLGMMQSKTLFTRAYFDELVIFGAATWWPAVNGHLHTLTLIDCQVSIDMVLEMLRATPTLKSFEFQDGSDLFFNDVDVDFKLEALEVLDVAVIEHIELLEVFAKMCPNLKKFVLFVDEKLKNTERQILNFVEAVQDTLIDFEFDCRDNIWPGLLKFKNLKLTRIASQGTVVDRFLRELSWNQPALEDIVVNSPIPDSILHGIGHRLKNLSSLSTYLESQETGAKLTFLDTMPTLETLTVTGSTDIPTLTIDVAKHPKLDTLRLELWQQVPSSNWFKHFPNLRSLELQQCTLASWSDLFVPITQLKQLKNLTLAWVEVTNSNEYLSDYLDALTFLTLQECEMTKSILISLLPLCKNLQEIHLSEMAILDDDIMLQLCQKLPKLATLQLDKCANVTDVTVQNVAKSTNLDWLILKGCKQISAEAAEQIKAKSINISFEAFVEKAVNGAEVQTADT